MRYIPRKRLVVDNYSNNNTPIKPSVTPSGTKTGVVNMYSGSGITAVPTISGSGISGSGSGIMVSLNSSGSGINNSVANTITPTNSISARRFNCVYFENDYVSLPLRKWTHNKWTGYVGADLMAAYTSGGYWAFGATGIYSPGVILTGSGNTYSNITDIVWVGLDPNDYGNTPPAPFDGSCFASSPYNWSQTTIKPFSSNQ